MTKGLSVLVIDDELQIRRLLRTALESAGWAVHEAATGQEGLSMTAFRRPDAILLDLGLPDLDGMEVLRRLREWSEIPVLVLSARGEEDSKVGALDAGADDYVTKPFGTSELLARLRASCRKSRPSRETHAFRFGNLNVDLSERSVMRRGKRLSLSATEYALLALFVRNAGRILTHRQILSKVWGPNSEEHRQYLRVYVTHLRQKIEPDPKNPTLILTESGIGYRFVEADV